MKMITWAEVPAPFRRLARWVTVVQLVGYTTSLAFVYHTTRMRASGVADRYRGIDPAAHPDAPMQFPKPMEEMLRITHTHLLSMLVIFLISGAALLFCARVSPRWKRFLVADPFVAILVSFAALWLTRFADPRFALLLMASSGLMAATFYLQCALVLRELGWRDAD
jgi:hypothetical protein